MAGKILLLNVNNDTNVLSKKLICEIINFIESFVLIFTKYSSRPVERKSLEISINQDWDKKNQQPQIY